MTALITITATKGAKQKAIEWVDNLLKNSVDPKIVSKSAGLSLGEVNTIQRSIH